MLSPLFYNGWIESREIKKSSYERGSSDVNLDALSKEREHHASGFPSLSDNIVLAAAMNHVPQWAFKSRFLAEGARRRIH